MKTILTFLVSFWVFFVYAQENPFGNDPFPNYTPFLNQEDIPENSRPFYAIDSSLVIQDCNYDFCEDDYFKGTFRYAYGPGRSGNDGNSTLDLYFAREPDSEAPISRPLVVLLHGNGIDSNKNSSSLKVLGNEFVKRGYAVIIPDYTTASDERWGGNTNPCLDKAQLTYVIQQSVRDVRAAIMRTLFLSTRSNANFSLDPNNIFIVGLSYGSSIAAHLAFYDIDDFPSSDESVTIEGETYSFSSSLDDIRICGNPNFAACMQFKPEPNYDIQDNVKGISLLSPFVLDTSAINFDDATGVLMFHGTCDAIVPYDTPSMKELTYRRAVRQNDGEFVDPETVVCADVDGLDYTLHGSLSIYRQILDLDNPEFYRGFFSFCKMDHGLNGYYLNQQNALLDTVYHGIATYETIRFFSNILNNNRKNSFTANLLHERHPLVDDDEVIVNCNSVPRMTDTLYTPTDSYLKGDPFPSTITLATFLCPDCDSLIFNPNRLVRSPIFRLSNNDNMRYRPAGVPACDEPAAIIMDQGQVLIEHNRGLATSVRVIDQSYRVVKEVPLGVRDSQVSSMLLESLRLQPGTYFLHFNNGEKQAIVIHE